ncbi:MAG: hypothetical protein QOE58_2386, partial [Actinomycetota bacterium]|nr:hypothetical protein [Actinomycetota bacterium]
MKVFISWSGVTSRQLAEVLHWWLPLVIQGTEPFVSAKDIDKGSTWTAVLAQELEDTDFGIICLTPENLASPWLYYEAGSIAKSVDSRVCPLLLGLEKATVSGPLSQLQLTSLEHDDINLMMRSMNKAAGLPLTDVHLEEAIKMWWPRLEERIKDIAVPLGPDPAIVPEPAKPESSESEMLQEVLNYVRRLDGRLASLNRSRPDRLIRSDMNPYKPASLSTWESELMVALGRGGMAVMSMMTSSSGIDITVSEMPVPLPGRVYT